MIKKFSERFEEWVTAWKLNDFFRARIKLMLLYIFMMGLILVIFAGAISYEIKERHKNTHQEKIYEEDESLLDEFADTIIGEIFLTSIFMLFFGSFLAYFVAGKTLRPIQEKIKAEKRFMADVSHELKNPLSAIRASSESILREKNISEKESREVFEEILEESDRLINLTQQLLKLEEKNSYEKNIKNQKNIKAQKIIFQVVKHLKVLADEKNIKIILNISDINLRIKTSDLEIIIFNLLHNAIKFSGENSKIILNLDENKKFSIQDFGKGISEKNIQNIFKRFYKTDVSRTFGKETGSGLGLSIVKKICDENGYKIFCESQKGAGSFFVVNFK